MAKLVILFGCVALLQIASAFQCYFCLKELCDMEDKWTKIECKDSADQTKEAVCARINYKDKAGKPWVKRSCELVPKSEVDKCTVADADDVTCKTCKTDLCNGNSASNINLSAIALVGTALAYFAPKFLL